MTCRELPALGFGTDFGSAASYLPDGMSFRGAGESPAAFAQHRIEPIFDLARLSDAKRKVIREQFYLKPVKVFLCRVVDEINARAKAA